MAVDTSVLRYPGERGHLSKSVAGNSDVTLTMDEAKAGILQFTGALTGSISVLFPNIDGIPWTVYNNTSGAFTLTCKVSGQTGVAVTQGKTAILFCNGTDIASQVNDAAGGLGLGTMATQNKTAVDITGGTVVGITDLAVADGGTGASAAAAARDNLAAAAKGTTSKSVAGAVDVALSAAESQVGLLILTGALTGSINVTIPDANAPTGAEWDVYNNTSGNYTLTLKTVSGTGVTVTQGKRARVYSNGTNLYPASTDAIVAGAAATGSTSKSVAGAVDVALSIAEAAVGALALTGAITANINVTIPDASAPAGTAWNVSNGTTGNYTVTVKTVSGTGVLVTQGKRTRVISDGVNLVASVGDLVSPAIQGTAAVQPTARLNGLNGLSERFELRWIAGAKGLPQLNAVTDPPAGDAYNTAAMTALLIADRDFELLGMNASSDDVTLNPEGGIILETDGADGDEEILLPHLNTGQSPWTGVTWGTDQQTIWSAHIKTGANITNAIIWAGLKLTNTEVIATDNDQVYFRYEDDVNAGKWEVVWSIANTDTETDTTVAAAINTDYHLVIAIAADRTARCYINGVLVATTTALTAADFIPYIGVAADGAGAAKSLIVRGQTISRAFA